MKKTLFLLAGLSVAATVGAVPILTMDEVSSSTLTYSVNGGAAQTATLTSPDNWTISLPGVEVVTSLGGVQNINVDWEEPDYAASGQVNYVNFYQYDGNGTTVTIVSDTLPDPNHTYPVVVNGGTYSFLTGTPPVAGGNTVAFTDTAEIVPEPSTIQLAGLALLGMSLFGVLAVRRKLSW